MFSWVPSTHQQFFLSADRSNAINTQETSSKTKQQLDNSETIKGSRTNNQAATKRFWYRGLVQKPACKNCHAQAFAEQKVHLSMQSLSASPVAAKIWPSSPGIAACCKEAGGISICTRHRFANVYLRPHSKPTSGSDLPPNIPTVISFPRGMHKDPMLSINYVAIKG